MTIILFFILPAVLCLLAQLNVKNTFRRYSKKPNSRGMTGSEIARCILDANGLEHIRVEPISGTLTDHYDPSANVIRLSEDVYDQTSISAIGVAAHECGHAVQRSREYLPYTVRSSLVPVTGLCSRLWYTTFMLGVFLIRSDIGWYLMLAGALLFAGVALFQVATLPVEFDASKRALKILEQDSYLTQAEIPDARKVLAAAALTYVAGLLQSLMQLLRLLLMLSGNRGRDRR